MPVWSSSTSPTKRQPTLVSQLDFGAETSAPPRTPRCRCLAATCWWSPTSSWPTTARAADARARGRHRRRAQPKVIAEFPVPEGDFCLRGGRFGPHNLHEMRPGSLVDPNTIYVTWFNAGLRVVDITDAQPAAAKSPTSSPDAPPGRSSIQFNDVAGRRRRPGVRHRPLHGRPVHRRAHRLKQSCAWG